MNAHANIEPQLSMADEVLVDIAVKIQLSPTLHQKAVQHYEAVMRHLERADSPLSDKIGAYYPQGSMAAGTTIRSKDQDDLFDIDLLIELENLSPDITPLETLSLLYKAVKGEKGSFYYDFEVVQQTRCVTIYYDEMHLDITPIFRNTDLEERSGRICHGKAEEEAQQTMVWANPWGFAEWFKERTPAERWFGRAILRKSFAEDGVIVEAADEVTPVPAHQAIYLKSLTVVGLQLFKRWLERNHQRRGQDARRPPSVLVSRLVGDVAGGRASLVDELIAQARHVRTELMNARAMGQTVRVFNPRLPADEFSDRWPSDLATQDEFQNDLTGYIAELERAKASSSIEELTKILSQLFGERATQSALKEYYSRAAGEAREGRSRVVLGSGVALAGAAFATAPEAKSVPAPVHRNFGD